VSAYDQRLAAIRAAHVTNDRVNGGRPDAWRNGRQGAYLAALTDALGVGLDRLDAEERATLRWLASWDDETVAGVAALLDRAREVAP
jgi:hypothetical protein